MKLFILASRFPYPVEKGDKLRMYHQIRELSKYHEVVLCALTDHEILPGQLEQLHPFCSRIYTFRRRKWIIAKSLATALFTSMPVQVAYFFDKKIQSQIRKVIQDEKPEHIYCQLIRTAPYAAEIPVPKTLDYMDNFSTWSQKLAEYSAFPVNKFWQWEADKVAAFEAAIFPKFDSHTIISEQDRLALGFPGKESIRCIPNGVDIAFFQPQPGIEKRYDVVFTGNLGYYNNVEAAKFLVQSIMPVVWKKYPDAKVLLAGARPSADVKRLAGNRVKVTGWLEDIREAYSSSKIFVAPIKLAVGLQNKILEAMAIGIPCITATHVNTAVGAEPGASILLADSAEEFAEKVILLIENRMLREKISNEALSFVRKNFSWETAVYELHKILLQST